MWLRALAALSLAGLASAASAAGDASVAFELLPPGARGVSDRAGLVWTRGSEAPRLTEVVRPASSGGEDWIEVEYTIDPELDARVSRVLAREGVALGHVVLLDPDTGAVLSYVSTRPDAFPATRTYPTASLMKLITAAAVLRNAPAAATRRCRYRGSPYLMDADSLRPPEIGGVWSTFEGALAISNNQCFARLAVNDVGEAALLTEMFRVGVFDAPAPGHAAGRIEPIEGSLDLAELGSGLDGSYITPLAAARLAAVLARGELVRPYWIERMHDAEGRPLAVPAREAPHRVWPAAQADALRRLLVRVTEDGTARNAFRSGTGDPWLGAVRVAGKTGTLSGSDPDGRYQWFVGVAPAERPRVAIATLVVTERLENGVAGGAPDPRSRARASASDVAAATLREVFCGPEGCRAVAAEDLQARLRARDALAEREEAARALVAFREETELDAPPRPLEVTPLAFPKQLRRKQANGEIVLLLELDRDGRVLDAQVDSSDLPEFEPFVLAEVARWRFTPPTWRGRPVRARARLPIPIAIAIE